ncbi:LOW QUALITY PROTEIN: UBN2_3 domain-containing protein, partial [Cephalotus follicularis]
LTTTLTTILNPLSNITNLVSIKLDYHNYLIWRSQFQPILRATQLYGYIDDSIACPLLKRPMSTDPTSFEIQCMKLEFLVTWINAILSEPMIPQVVSLTTSTTVWSTLEHFFTSQLRSRIMQLSYQLQTVKKGSSLTITDYFNHLKGIADSLAPASQPVVDSDLVLYVLGGLSQGYVFVTAVMTRYDPLSYEDLYSLLLNNE